MGFCLEEFMQVAFEGSVKFLACASLLANKMHSDYDSLLLVMLLDT